LIVVRYGTIQVADPELREEDWQRSKGNLV
jgi:hypothetical protein